MDSAVVYFFKVLLYDSGIFFFVNLGVGFRLIVSFLFAYIYFLFDLRI